FVEKKLSHLTPEDASILTVIAQFVANLSHGAAKPSPQTTLATERVVGLYEGLSPGVPRQVALELLTRAKVDTSKIRESGPRLRDEPEARELTQKMARWAGIA